jgi:hypothetical protein
MNMVRRFEDPAFSGPFRLEVLQKSPLPDVSRFEVTALQKSFI